MKYASVDIIFVRTTVEDKVLFGTRPVTPNMIYSRGII